MRPPEDDEDQDWWFASTAVPLLAATLGPLANVLSIAALVTPWRLRYNSLEDRVLEDSHSLDDPDWSIAVNVVSLVCGFIGNIFLLFNFTSVIRYIIALPMTIIMWYIATGILMALTLSLRIYMPPQEPLETYSQGFWYAVIAAVLYMFCSIILMVNMLGYFLGHYPQHFILTDDHRNLILQSMMFFLWLAGGAAIFMKANGWRYVDSIYFCDVTILTVGFGDFVSDTDVGRGLTLPYSVGGIIILGLLVGSIAGFAKELSQTNVIRSHVERRRLKTLNKSVTIPRDIEHADATADSVGNKNARKWKFKKFKKIFGRERVFLGGEKDRFDAMRNIQHETVRFKRWYALTMSSLAYLLLWGVGSVVFWKAEGPVQGLTYFESLYFCYVSLLTIGYGDFAPRSAAGRPFFVVWSLVAIPTMTILISHMSDTVVAAFKRFTFRVGDYIVLPQRKLWKHLLERNAWLVHWTQRHAAKKQQPEPESDLKGKNSVSAEPVLPFDELSTHERARRLAAAIRTTADDMKAGGRQYSYDEWMEYTRLIQFTCAITEDYEKSVEWDWIGTDGPLTAESETEWLLDRLVESLGRYMRNVSSVEESK